MKNFSELSAQAAALENAHDYEAANKKWTDAAKIGNEDQARYAMKRAGFCETAMARAYA